MDFTNFFNNPFESNNNFFGDAFNRMVAMMDMERKLDRLWSACDFSRYTEYVNKTKQQGYKIYRNSEGKHKIK